MYRAIIIFLCACCLSACKDNGGETPVQEEHVMMAYLGADNNLTGEAVSKLEALRKGTLLSTHRVVAYADMRGSGARLFSIYKGVITQVASYGEENSADPAVLRRVISDIASRYPARSYGLIVFSHASGWLPPGEYSNATRSSNARSAADVRSNGTRSIISDGTQEMELSGFASAIPDKFFRYIVFEACFFAGADTAYELRNKADYILGSSAEILSPGFSWIYPSGLPYTDNAAVDLTDFARRYYEYYNALDGLYRSATVSVIRTSGLDALATGVKQALAANPGSGSASVAGLQCFDIYDRYFFDLGDWAQKSLPAATAARIEALAADCIVYKAATPQISLDGQYPSAVAHHSGFTIYVLQTGQEPLNSYYSGLEWYKATR